MQWDIIQQVIRMGLQLAAGILVTKGYVNESGAEQLIGGLMSISSVAWWAVWNRKREV